MEMCKVKRKDALLEHLGKHDSQYEHILGIVPKGTHQYQNFIKPSEIYKTAKKHNLQLIKTAGIDYNPLAKTHKVKITNSLDINYLMCFRKLPD